MKVNKAKTKAFLASSQDLLKTSQTMSDIFRLAMDRNPLGAALVSFDAEGKKVVVTYEDYKSRVFVTASKLATVLSGTGAGTIIGLKIKNQPAWPIYFWALLMCGHSPLLIDAKLATENAANLIRQAKAKAIITDDSGDFGVPSYSLATVEAIEADYSFKPDWANHILFCSSGTTGDAKMMVYDGKNMVNQILGALNLADENPMICHYKKINILAMIPLHHIFGFVAVFLWYTWYGKTLVFSKSTATSDLMEAIHKGEITHLYSVPMFWDSIAQAVIRKSQLEGSKEATILQKMIAYNTGSISRKEAGKASWGIAKKTVQKKLLGTHIQYCISGGGYLSPKTANTINGLGYPLYNGYGMTEIGVACVELSPSVARRLKGSIGHPMYGYQFRIGEGKGETSGQLYVKSEVNHKKKFIGGVLTRNKPEEEWYPTGDIAEIDELGGYYIKGRIKDTIILANGENVYPDEIEYYFRDIKKVNNCVVLGVQAKGDTEERITLVVEVDNSVDAEGLKKIKADIDAINGSLQSEKRVQKILIDRRPLPMANNMKVKRVAIKEGIMNGSNDFMDFDQKKKEAMFEGYDPKEVEEYSKRIAKVFAKVLLLPEYKIDGDANWITDLGGDSMSYIEMASNVNESEGVEIPEEKYGVLVCLNDFVKEVIDLKHAKESK